MYTVVTYFLFPLPSLQALSSYSIQHCICSWRPCLVAVCAASCGLSVLTILPTMTGWCHQVNMTSAPSCLPPPIFNTLPIPPFLPSHPSSLALCFASLSIFHPSIPQSVVLTWISAQLTVCMFPLAGMTMSPYLEGFDIIFNASDRKAWKKYAKSMEEYLKRELQTYK